MGYPDVRVVAVCDVPLTAGIPEFRPRFGVPEPPGKAAPVAGATLRAGDRTFTRPVGPEDKSVTVRVELKAGRTQIQGWFQHKDGLDLCGAYHAYVAKV